MSAPTVRPRVALTMGDPAGIGPEIAAKLLADPSNRAKADIFVLADRKELDAASRIAKVDVPIADTAGPDGVQILDDGSAPDEPIAVAKISKQAGDRAFHQLKRGVALANEGKVDAIVFMPLNKTSMHMAGMNEEDELRWFAKYLRHDGVTSEVNIVDDLWTARVTSHIPMKDVAGKIKAASVTKAIELLNDLLSEYGLPSPRLGVCALNPHNGENGLFGREELDEIAPGVQAAQATGINVKGPYPSDTIFVSMMRKQFDGIVTMYHDQGQIALKVMGFEGGVTLQGGLPIVVTTPAHGTAFNIVGQNVASTRSAQRALSVAIEVAARRAAKKNLEGEGKAVVEAVNGAVSSAANGVANGVKAIPA